MNTDRMRRVIERGRSQRRVIGFYTGDVRTRVEQMPGAWVDLRDLPAGWYTRRSVSGGPDYPYYWPALPGSQTVFDWADTP